MTVRERGITEGPAALAAIRRLSAVLVAALCLLVDFGASATAYQPALRRYPYLTDAAGGGVTVNWATARTVMLNVCPSEVSAPP